MERRIETGVTMNENARPLKIGDRIYIEGTIIHGFVHAPARTVRCGMDEVITITIPSELVARVTEPSHPPLFPVPPEFAPRLECVRYNTRIDGWLENAYAYVGLFGDDPQIARWMDMCNGCYINTDAMTKNGDPRPV